MHPNNQVTSTRGKAVKPTSQASPKEIAVDDYFLSPHASLSQAFDSMNIKLATNLNSLRISFNPVVLAITSWARFAPSCCMHYQSSRELEWGSYS
jgi:hypothetical protein